MSEPTNREGGIMMKALKTYKQNALIASPFESNAEFLEAKQYEFSLLLECAHLKRIKELKSNLEYTNRNNGNNQTFLFSDLSKENNNDNSILNIDNRIEMTIQKYLSEKIRNKSRLTASNEIKIPFLDMVSHCNLDQFDQDVIWLLFLKTVSSNFKKQLEDSKLIDFDYKNRSELTIGFLLQILCPNSFFEQLEGRKHFSVKAPLVAYNLIQFERDVEDCSSILDVEVFLPQRVTNWISDDNNIYMNNMPYIVEYPKDSLSQVILPQRHISQILTILEHYDEYIQERKRIGIERTITYGRALVILEYGPSGTGKTLLARAISNHTGRPLISLLKNESLLRDIEDDIRVIFREAQLRKGIVFFDECEGIFDKDNNNIGNLLNELEKTDAIVIMATNKPEKLAPALDRRISLKIPFFIPDRNARKQIWKISLPKQVPLDPKVDLEYLACNYPFAGGYIKNAILLAINFALARCDNGKIIIRQEDLENAIRMQEQHIGGACKFRKIVKSNIKLNQCLISPKYLPKVNKIIQIAKNYRKVMMTLNWNNIINSNSTQGFKILIRSELYQMGLQVIEAIAGEIDLPMDQVCLNDILDLHKDKSHSEDKAERLIVSELFSLLSGTEHILVFTDERGLLSNLKDNKDDESTQDFFELFSKFNGVAIILSSYKKRSLSKLSRVFHEILSLDEPENPVRIQYWKNMLNGTIPMKSDIDLEKLIIQHDLSIEQIQDVMHRFCLLIAAEDSEPILGKDIIESAIIKINEINSGNGILFG